MVEAIACLAVARLLMLLPFRHVAPLLGPLRPAEGSWSAALDAEGSAAAIAVRRALARVAQRLPWEASCLVRAIAGRMMLQRRGVPSILHLGARSGHQAELAAHAWLSCGDVHVTGAEIADQYTPIATFRA
ncbi:MAG TPA: lasso peptide biosynthesis B2 protein [Stellaceae bacterium]|nr:lasso peptide biosynthesis B2 protein [Stellaceae bacterium]